MSVSQEPTVFSSKYFKMGGNGNLLSLCMKETDAPVLILAYGRIVKEKVIISFAKFISLWCYLQENRNDDGAQTVIILLPSFFNGDVLG